MIKYTDQLPPKYVWNDNWPRWKNLCAAYTMTADYDPMYVALNQSLPLLDKDAGYELLMAYILFYDIGVACQVVEMKGDFWSKMFEVYPTAARGGSRRYFRGDVGLNSLQFYKETFKTPEGFFAELYATDYKSMVAKFDKYQVPQFGDYYMWKMMDLYDRVLGERVAVDDWAISRLPKAPRKGALMVSQELGLDKCDFEYIVKHMVNSCQESEMYALPHGDRLIGIPEVETFLCGISHHYVGRDYVGKDLDKNEKSLAAVQGVGSEVAHILRMNCPSVIPKDWFVEPGQVENQGSLFDLFGG